jgi:hypothetical protein
MSIFGTSAERRAAAAQRLTAFHDLNLVGIRDKVAQILQQIGRDGLFREYTLHDISHVDGMLLMLDWLIPSDTASVMTPTDWLLIVLSIYFHDVGMLATKAEFDARDQSGFVQFCEDELFVGDAGAEYRSKVDALGDESELFLYQEFVRYHHANRIGDWIDGRANAYTGISSAAAKEVSAVIDSVPAEFRADLSLVCKSHHEMDLKDLSKYKVSQPYGNSDAETANVHYAALILRTADLLNITSSRTPSVMFRLIAPENPISQREWSKQMAVRRVRPQRAKDRHGHYSDEATQDTIEVFASFSDDSGFFGLTSYLRYAEQQLVQSRDWANSAREHAGSKYEFPWQQIDDKEVTAEGFLSQKLSFSLDQDRILDLLTGHTLYNDVSVVIRELTQNALDACRLQALIEGAPSEEKRVLISWDSRERTLVIRDDGTGMSQRVIEQNLLRAGASRYQEDSFKREHPSFSAISKFGIGVLSTFMIADRVEIVTCSEDDEKARSLTLQSVHGRYLVRFLDKHTHEQAQRLFPHGTEVVLRVRASVELPDVLETVKKWIVIPRCQVDVVIDGGAPVSVGYRTPADALRDYMEALGAKIGDEPELSNGVVRVDEEEKNGVATAFAVSWSRYFRNWSFVHAASDPRALLGTCVEGIRVEDSTPGYNGRRIAAISNACGHGAPKTNVARSGLETSPELNSVLHQIYAAYLGHVARECDELTKDRGMSISGADVEARLLMHSLSGGTANSNEKTVQLSPGTFADEIRRKKLLLFESNGKRAFRSPEEMSTKDIIWTTESPLVVAAERLMREIPTYTTATVLAKAFNTEALSPPEGVMLVGYSGKDHHHEVAFQDREPACFVIRRDERRLDIGWKLKGDDDLWTEFEVGAERYSYRRSGTLLVATNSPDTKGFASEVGVTTNNRTYLLPGTEAGSFLLSLRQLTGDAAERREAERLAAGCIVLALTAPRRPDDLEEFIDSSISSLTDDLFGDRRKGTAVDLIDLGGLAEAIANTPSEIFNAAVWSRHSVDVIWE